MGYSQALPFNLTAASQQLDNTGGRVSRYSLRDLTTTGGSVIEVYDGTSVNGILLDSIALTAGQSTRERFEEAEYCFDGGLFVNVVSGQVKGTIVVKHSDDWGREGKPVILVNPEVLSLSFPSS